MRLKTPGVAGGQQLQLGGGAPEIAALGADAEARPGDVGAEGAGVQPHARGRRSQVAAQGTRTVACAYRKIRQLCSVSNVRWLDVLRQPAGLGLFLAVGGGEKKWYRY